MALNIKVTRIEAVPAHATVGYPPSQDALVAEVLEAVTLSQGVCLGHIHDYLAQITPHLLFVDHSHSHSNWGLRPLYQLFR